MYIHLHVPQLEYYILTLKSFGVKAVGFHNTAMYFPPYLS